MTPPANDLKSLIKVVHTSTVDLPPEGYSHLTQNRHMNASFANVPAIIGMIMMIMAWRRRVSFV